MAWKTGDVVVSVHHGAAQVVGTERRRSGQAMEEFVVLRVLSSDLEILLPNGSNRGLRAPIGQGHTLRLLKQIGDPPPDDTPTHWSRRFKVLQEHMRDGTPEGLATVIAILGQQDRVTRISPAEREIYQAARGRLAGEIALVRGLERADVECMIDEALARAGTEIAA